MRSLLSRSRQRWRTIWRITLLALLLVVGPYVFSRLASPWRRLSVHATSQGTLSTEAKHSLRIACYNIAHGRGQAQSNWTGESKSVRQTRLEDIAELLRSLDADIVILNEVDFDSSWSHSVNQAQFLAQAAGYPYRVEQRNLDFRILFWKWRFGNAILSRFPIRESQVLDFPSFSRWESILAGKKRGVACSLEFLGHQIEVAGVHLSHRSEELRARSIPLLTSGTGPQLIAGDFNSTPAGFPNSSKSPDNGNAMDRIDETDRFQRIPQQPPSDESQYTFHSARPRSVIDWILATHDWKVVEYRAVPSLLSDHRLVLAEVLLEDEADQSRSLSSN